MTPVWMIRPAAFGPNDQTARTNDFQSPAVPPSDVAERARVEFDGLVAALRGAGVTVYVSEDPPEPRTPDAVFPNNWVSFHQDGTVVLYPMLDSSRQAEVRPELIQALVEDHGLKVRGLVDLRAAGGVLEGTGSLVLDREHRVAYAALSPRTELALAEAWCETLDYSLVTFEAVGARGAAIYHTNVMMSVAPGFAVVCGESVLDAGERSQLEASLAVPGRALIDITVAQVGQMAGNVLWLDGVTAMSTRAREAFTPAQRLVIESSGPIVHAPLDTIERFGGGSARCMLAEVLLPS